MPEIDDPEPVTADSPGPAPDCEAEGLTPEACEARRKYGFFRRFVLRSLMWSLALGAALVFFGGILINTPRSREWARQQIETQLESALEREVKLARVSFELLPLTVELEGLEIGGGPEFPNDPFLVLPRAEIEGDLEIFARRRLRLRMVKLDRPRIDLRFTARGDNLIGGGGAGGAEGLEVLLDRLEIDRGEVLFDDEQIEISFVADALRANLLAPSKGRLQGDFATPRVLLRLPAAEPIELAMQGRVGLHAEGLEIEDTVITSAGLELKTRGGCDWSGRGGQGDKCDFETRGRAEGAVLAQMGYFADLAGPFRFDGRLSWRGGPIGWRGRVLAEELDLWSFKLRAFDGKVSADRFGARLELSSLEYAGGQIGGTLTVDLAAKNDPLALELTVAGLAVDTLLDDVGVPVTGIGSTASGQLALTAPIAQIFAGDGLAEIELQAAEQGGGLPLSGPVPLRYEKGTLHLGAVSLRSATQGILVGGSYDLAANRGRLRFEVATGDASELVELVLGPAAPGTVPPPWAPQRGIGRAEVDLVLEKGSYRAGLVLELEQVETTHLKDAEVRGSLELTPLAAERLRLDLGHAVGSALHGSALTLAGRVPYNSKVDPIELTIDAYSWPLAELKPFFDFELPIDGPISGHLELLLSEGRTRGTLDANVKKARWIDQDLSLDYLEAHLAWDDEKLRFHEIEARSAAGLVRGGGSLTWADQRLELKLRGSGLDLAAAPLAAYRPSPELGGELTFEATLEGPLARPQTRLSVELRKLSLGGRALVGPVVVGPVVAGPIPAGPVVGPVVAGPIPVGPLPLGPGAPGKALDSHRLEAFWDGERLTLEGLVAGSLSFRGGGRLDETGSDLELRIKAGELGELASIFAVDAASAGLGGELEGRLAIRGPLASPELFFDFDRWRLELVGHTLVARPGARIERRPAGWVMSGLVLEEESSGTFFQLSGELHDLDGLSLDVRSELSADWLGLALADLGSDFEFKPYGRLAFDGRLSGPPALPSLSGRAELLGLSLALPGVEEGLRDLRGTVLFTPFHVDLGRLEGKLAGGRIAISGQVDLPRPGEGGKGPSPLVYALQVSGRELGLRRADGWAVQGDVDLTLRSLERGHFLGGRVDLTRLDYRREIRLDVAQLLRDFLRRQRLEVQPASSTLAAIQLNLEVSADKTVRVVNNLADLRGSADFTLRGTLAAPLIYGEIAIEPGGRLRYNGSDYQVERGRLIFADPFKIDPEVDLVAQTRVREFDINLAVFGNLNRLETRFDSQPPLPDVEVFRLLAEGDFGGEPVQPNLQRGEESSLSAASFLYGQAASAIGERVSNLFGLDKFRVDPLLGTSGDNLSAARVTVGKRLSRRLSLTYSVDPSSTESQRLQVEWRLGEGLVLVLTQNGDNTYSADARWDTSF